MVEKIGPDFLCLEILYSIHDIDIRIDESRRLCHNQANQEKRQNLVKRLERLIHTRFELLSSLQDTISANPNSVFGSLNLNYEKNYKRPLKVVGIDQRVHKKRYFEITCIETIGLVFIGVMLGMFVKGCL